MALMYTALRPPTQQKKSSLLSSFITLTSTIIGAGLLGLPHAFAQLGWVPGLILLAIGGANSAFGLHFLSLCARKVEYPSSFYAVAQRTIPNFSWLVDLSVAVKCYGVATSYLIVIGDLMPAAMDQLRAHDFFCRRSVWVSIGFIIVLPLSCFRNLDSLKWTSVISLMFVIFLVSIVVFFYFLDPCVDSRNELIVNCRGNEELFDLDKASLQPISVYIFAYTCQQNIFGIINELSEPSRRRVKIVIMSSVGAAWSIYVVVASFAYLTFGGSIASDLFKNYPEDVLMTCARILVSLIVAFHFPLQLNPARKSVISILDYFFSLSGIQAVQYKSMGPHSPALPTSLLSGRRGDRPQVSSHGSLIISELHAVTLPPSNPPSQVGLDTSGDQVHSHTTPSSDNMRRSSVITVIFCVSSFVVALSTSNLGKVLGVVGATGSSVISCILPGLFYSRMFGPKVSLWKYYVALLQLYVGFLVIPVCLYFTLS